MSVLTIVEIVITFLQQLGLIGQIDLDWPTSFAWVRNIVKYFSIDFSLPFDTFDLPPLDYRAQHIILTNIIPLCITIILLVFFKTVAIVLWYSALLTAIGILATGFVLQFIPLPSEFSSQASIAQNLIIGGASAIGVLLLSYVINIVWVKYKLKMRFRVKPTGEAPTKKGPKMKTAKVIGDENDEKVDEFEEDQFGSEESLLKENSVDDMPRVKSNIDEERPDMNAIVSDDKYKPKPLWKMFRNFTVSGVLIIFGFLTTKIIDISFLETYYGAGSTDEFENTFDAIGSAIGIVCLIFGGALFYNFLMNTFRGGRKFNTIINSFVRKNVIKINLFLLTLLYIPITTSILNAGNCAEVQCPSGTEFPPRSFIVRDVKSFAYSFSAAGLNSSMACDSCRFDNTCPIADKLCPSVADLRLIKDQTLSCSKEMLPFYLPGAILMFISATLGIPYCFYKLTRICSKYISEIPVTGKTDEIKWAKRALLSNNSCKTLYFMFEHRWRYYKLIGIIYKLVIVSIFVFANRVPSGVVLAICSCHTVFFLISVYARPYRSLAEDGLATICILMNVMNSVVAILIGFAVEIPSEIPYVLVSINAAFPAIASLVGVIAEKQREKKDAQLLKEKEEEEEKEKEKEKAAGGKGKEKEKKVLKSSTIKGNGKVNSEEEEKIDETKTIQLVKRLDAQLNSHLLKVLVNFFLFMGVTAFLSLCAVSIGVIRTLTASNNLSISTPKRFDTTEEIVAFEFAGAKSWTEFTQRCCCQHRYDSQAANITGSGLDMLVETWKCLPSDGNLEFVYKQRLRWRKDVGNGLRIRDYCSTSFKTGCSEPFWDEISRTVRVRCLNLNINEMEEMDYW